MDVKVSFFFKKKKEEEEHACLQLERLCKTTQADLFWPFFWNKIKYTNKWFLTSMMKD